MAVKDGATTWTVFLKGKPQFSVTNDDLMDPSRFFVQCKCLSDERNSIERKKQSAKQKRACLSEKLEREQTIHQKAMEELRKFEKKEFENIVSITKSGSEY